MSDKEMPPTHPSSDRSADAPENEKVLSSSSGDEDFEERLQEQLQKLQEMEQRQLQQLQQTRQLIEDIRDIQEQRQNQRQNQQENHHYDIPIAQPSPYHISSRVASNPMARVPLYLTHVCYGRPYCHSSCCSTASSQYPSVSTFDQSLITSTFLPVPVPIQQLPSQYVPSYLPTNSSNILPGQSASRNPNVGSDNPNPFHELATIPEMPSPMPSPPPQLRRQIRNQNEVEPKKPKSEDNGAEP
uniref:Uncharacterized protein n=1 Tax=Panagrolaimus superbus TaxID=310955 RepID=A0A914Y3X7_9BILA